MDQAASSSPAKSKKPLFVFAVLLLACAGLGRWWWTHPGGMEVTVEIAPGLGAIQTARLLKREGVIRSVWLFRLSAKAAGMERGLKPGEYIFRRGMSERLALLKIHAGDVATSKVVIPEGFMAKQIADRLEALGVTKADDFMAVVRAKQLEGFLFPTTYFFPRKLPAEKVAQDMLDEFERQVRPVFDSVKQTRFTMKQAVTLASVVQREAAVIDEMPMIASVYSNRLAKRMRLEADPTVQYAMGMDTGEWYKGLRFKHLDNRSKYNTYMYNGLPPGPICSPGVDAVKAALNPAASDKLFFVADLTGRHVFTRTLDEHNAAIARIKAQKKRQVK